MPDDDGPGELHLRGDDVPPRLDVEANFLALCVPGEHGVLSGLVPDPDHPWGLGLWLVLHWDGRRVHYTATRWNPVRYWLARRRADRAYAEHLRAAWRQPRTD